MHDEPKLADTQPMALPPVPADADTKPPPVPPFAQEDGLQPAQFVKPFRRFAGCLVAVILLGACLGVFVFTALFLPPRANILLLGIDQTPPGSAAGRSDTMILTTVRACEPYMGMLSIPRDLWVSIPGAEEGRINTAHYLAESQRRGTGPAVAIQTVRYNFEVDVHFYVRIQFEGIQAIVDALGGIPIELEQPTGVLPAGRHILDGRMALIFLRDRIGSDDISRMQRGQLFLRALAERLLDPRSWPGIPLFLVAVLRTVETDMPPWVLAKIALTVLLIGPEGIDSRVIGWEMVRSFTTESGASILAPDWTKINPMLLEMFGQ